MFFFYFLIADMNNEAQPEGGKRKQHCTFCKNHGFETPKNGHRCKYKDCTCILCELTRRAQKTMRHQQRVWRYQKNQLNKPRADGTDGQENGFISNEKLQLSGLNSRQVNYVLNY